MYQVQEDDYVHDVLFHHDLKYVVLLNIHLSNLVVLKIFTFLHMNVYVFVHVYIHVDVNYKCICSSCSAFKYKKYNFTVFFRQTPLQLTQKELPI